MSQPFGRRFISGRREVILGDDGRITGFSLTASLRRAELAPESIGSLEYSKSVIKRDSAFSHSPHTHGGVRSTRLHFQYCVSSLKQFCVNPLVSRVHMAVVSTSERGVPLQRRDVPLTPTLGRSLPPSSALLHKIREKTGEGPGGGFPWGLTMDLKPGSFIHRD